MLDCFTSAFVDGFSFHYYLLIILVLRNNHDFRGCDMSMYEKEQESISLRIFRVELLLTNQVGLISHVTN